MCASHTANWLSACRRSMPEQPRGPVELVEHRVAVDVQVAGGGVHVAAAGDVGQHRRLQVAHVRVAQRREDVRGERLPRPARRRRPRARRARAAPGSRRPAAARAAAAGRGPCGPRGSCRGSPARRPPAGRRSRGRGARPGPCAGSGTAAGPSRSRRSRRRRPPASPWCRGARPRGRRRARHRPSRPACAAPARACSRAAWTATCCSRAGESASPGTVMPDATSTPNHDRTGNS